METKKPGRPTEAIKDTTIRLRVDKNFIENVDAMFDKKRTTRSEFIRDSLVPSTVSYADFEGFLGLSKLDFLEKVSQKCIDFLRESFLEISELELEDNFPASLDHQEEYVKVKYPTVKVKALIKQHNSLAIVKEYLADFENEIWSFDALSVAITKDRIEPTYLPEILCWKRTLQENKALADSIITILQSKGIKCELWPAYYEVKIPVKITKKEDGLYIKNAKA